MARNQIKARSESTDMAPYLSLVDQLALRIELPPIKTQLGIIDVLGVLDAKIELNRRMSDTLEAVARALFKSWFADFHPVRAKAEGYPTGLPENITALFPSSLNADGFPEGWQGQAGSIGELSRSVINPADVDPATPYIGLEHFQKRKLIIERNGSAEHVESAKIPFCTGDFLFGKLRPYFHKVAIAPLDGICSSDIFVFRPCSAVPRTFLYLSFSQADFVESASNASSGTRMPRADWSYMRRLSAILPSPDVLAAFDKIVSPHVDAMLARASQSRTLAALRDTLLPKLISGDLRIADAEQRIAAA